MKPNEPQTSRRQWITGLLRGGVLAAFGGSAYGLLRRNRSGENACVDPKGRTGCPACGVFDGCRLPRALSVKQVLNESTHEHNEQPTT